MIPQVAGVLAIAVVVLAHIYLGDFERYAIYSVGVFKRVAHEPVTLKDSECCEHWCDVDAGDGEHRRWFKEIVLAGVPIATYGGGETYYCINHADAEIQLGLYEGTTRARDRLVWALIWVAERFATDAEVPEESEFDAFASDMTTAAGTALQLLPVACLILFAALLMSWFHTTGTKSA